MIVDTEDRESRRERQDLFLGEFAKTGIATTAILETGLPYTQHYRWLKDDPEYAQRFAALKEQTRELAAANRKPHPGGPGMGRPADLAKRRRQKDAFLTALAKTGIIMDAAREAGFYPSQYYQWCRSDQDFREQAEAIIRATEETRQQIVAGRLGAASKARWDDPARREAWSEFQRSTWTPERRAAVGERTRERMADPEYRAAWLEAHQAYRATPEAREANSERMKRLWRDPEFRERYQAAIDKPERRARLSEAATQQWAALTDEERNARMRRTRRAFKGGHKLTSIEAAVMLALNEREIPYLAHKQIDAYVADIYVPSLKLIIECDGAWHHDRRNGTDEQRDAALAELGYRTLRLDEAEIKAGDWVRLDEAIGPVSLI